MLIIDQMELYCSVFDVLLIIICLEVVMQIDSCHSVVTDQAIIWILYLTFFRIYVRMSAK